MANTRPIANLAPIHPIQMLSPEHKKRLDATYNVHKEYLNVLSVIKTSIEQLSISSDLKEASISMLNEVADCYNDGFKGTCFVYQYFNYADAFINFYKISRNLWDFVEKYDLAKLTKTTESLFGVAANVTLMREYATLVNQLKSSLQQLAPFYHSKDSLVRQGDEIVLISRSLKKREKAVREKLETLIKSEKNEKLNTLYVKMKKLTYFSDSNASIELFVKDDGKPAAGYQEIRSQLIGYATILDKEWEATRALAAHYELVYAAHMKLREKLAERKRAEESIVKQEPATLQPQPTSTLAKAAELNETKGKQPATGESPPRGHTALFAVSSAKISSASSRPSNDASIAPKSLGKHEASVVHTGAFSGKHKEAKKEKQTKEEQKLQKKAFK